MKEPRWFIAITTLGCFVLVVSDLSLWWRISSLVFGIGGLLKWIAYSGVDTSGDTEP